MGPGKPFNKGALFNVGYFVTKEEHDYMVLHDVDQVPETKENDYKYREKPTHLLRVTSQWDYKDIHSHIVGGALMITYTAFERTNGYSNVFWGWGNEDANMANRLKRHGGYNRLSVAVGRYRELPHERVWGLDTTPQ